MGGDYLKLIDNSRDRRYTLTTAMSSSGEELKSRLENMLFFLKRVPRKGLLFLYL